VHGTSRKTPNVVSEGLALLLAVAPEVPGGAGVHIGALEVAGKGLPQVIPMVYDVSREMVQLGSGGFSQIDREELDDEHIIICPSHSTREAVILHPNAGVNFAVVFGYVAWRLETSQKTSVAHGTSEYLGTGPFGAKAASLMIIAAPSMWVSCMWQELCTVILWAMQLVCQRLRWDTQPSPAATGREAF
jgi:hypothetical protein